MIAACNVSSINYALDLLTKKLPADAIITHKWLTLRSPTNPHRWDDHRDSLVQLQNAIATENSVDVLSCKIKHRNLMIFLAFNDACTLLAFGVTVGGEKFTPMKANCQQFDVYCFNCYRPGHFATSPERGRSSGKCSFPTRCGYCSEPHDTKYCPLRHTHVPINYHPQWKCPNCFGPHVAWSDECRAEDVSKMRQTLAKPGWGPAADKRADQYIAFLRASGQGPTNMDASQVAPQSTPPQPIQQPLAAPPPPFQPLAAPPPPIRPMASPPPVSRPVSPIMAVEPTAQSRAHLASPSTPRTRAPVVRIPPALEPGENSLRVIYDRLLDEQQTALDAIFLPHDLTQPKRQPGRGAKRKQGDDSGRDNTKKRRLPDYNLADDMKAEALRLATTMEHSNLGLAASALPPSLTPTPSPETLPPPTPTQHATGIAPSTPEMVPAPSQAPTVRAAGFKILNAVAEMLLLIASQNV